MAVHVTPGWPSRIVLAILGLVYFLTLCGIVAVPGAVLGVLWLVLAILVLAGQ